MSFTAHLSHTASDEEAFAFKIELSSDMWHTIHSISYHELATEALDVEYEFLNAEIKENEHSIRHL